MPKSLPNCSERVGARTYWSRQSGAADVSLCDNRLTSILPRSDPPGAKSCESQNMKLHVPRQTDRIVPRASSSRSARQVALTFIGVFVCAVEVCSVAAEDENTIYDSNPKHLWNRLHEALFIRTAPDWKSYGIDRLDPL